VRGQHKCLNGSVGAAVDTSGLATASVYADVKPEVLAGAFVDVGCSTNLGNLLLDLNVRRAWLGEDINMWTESELRLQWQDVPVALRVASRTYDGPDFNFDGQSLRLGIDVSY
jgi:hypothetical protein